MTRLEEQRRERGAGELHDDVAGHPAPREVAASRERQAHGRVEVGARHLAHEQDDRHHHQTRRRHRRGPADGVREGLAHHPAARGDEHQEERPEQLREQAPPLLARVLEVLDRVDHRGVEPLLEPDPTACCVASLLVHVRPSRRGGWTDRRLRRSSPDAPHDGRPGPGPHHPVWTKRSRRGCAPDLTGDPARDAVPLSRSGDPHGGCGPPITRRARPRAPRAGDPPGGERPRHLPGGLVPRDRRRVARADAPRRGASLRQRPHREQRIAAAVLGAGTGAVASHRSAAHLWGIPRPDDDAIDVTLLDRRRQATLDGVVVHRPRDRLDITPVVRHHIRTSGVLRLLCDLGAVDPPSVPAAVDHVLTNGLASPEALRTAIDAHARRGRHGVPALHDALADRVLDGRA